MLSFYMNTHAENTDNTDTTHIYTDVLIIGAGPVGLFAAFACEMHGLQAHIVDSMSVAGGQCAAFYPDKIIYDIPGFVGISGQQFIANLIQQTQSMNIQMTLNTNVQKIIEQNLPHAELLKNLQKANEYSTNRVANISSTANIHHDDRNNTYINSNPEQKHQTTNNTTDSMTSDNHKLIAISANHTFHAKYIILATGAGGFDHNKLIAKQIGLTQDEMTELEQTHIKYTLPKDLADKIVVILGGGDTALDYALMAAQHATKVYIIHRRATFSGLTHTLHQLQKLHNVIFLTETILLKIMHLPATNHSTSAQNHYIHSTIEYTSEPIQSSARVFDKETQLSELSQNIIFAHSYTSVNSHIKSSRIALHIKQNDKEITLEADYIIPCYGFKHANTSALHPEIQTLHGKILVNPDTYQTHVANVYCVGDASYYPNKSKLFSIARGFGEVASLF